MLASLAFLAGVMAAPALGAEPDASGMVETAEGVSIYFERYGSGPKFVFVPNRIFMPEFGDLSKPGRTLVLYDMRNRGKSARVEDVSKLNILGDIADVEAMRSHFGAERISLVGYSYLGLMTALYAAQNPERVERLVQIGPVPRVFGTPYPGDQRAGADSLSDEGRAAGEAWLAARDAAGPDSNQRELCEIQRRFSSFWLVGDPKNSAKVPNTCIYESELPAASARQLNAHFGDIQTREFGKEQFTSLTLPVLTIHGLLDRNASYGAGLEWATTFQNGRLITVEGGAHQVWLDDPSVLKDIDAFLDGEWPERAQRFGRE